MTTISTTLPLFFMGLRGSQAIFILIIILLIFGAARLPKIMRNLGKGVHSFRQGIEDAKEEMNKPIVKHDQHPTQETKNKDTDRSTDTK